MPDAIGGYFGLELPPPSKELYRDALCVQSGRAALQAALRAWGIRRLWVPWFVCHAVPDAAAAAGTDVLRYTLEALDEPPDIQTQDDEAVLVVDYFGLCARATNAVISSQPAGRAIIDASQAFYAAPAAGVPTFYSPRKFFGVPDGGYLLPRLAASQALIPETGTPARMAHLFERLTGDIHTGYADFQVAEASLHDTAIREMSALTHDLLRRIDYEACAQRRRTNFAFLHMRLRDRNDLAALCDGASDAVPLCYPLLLDEPVEQLRAQLAAAEIFVPLYWPELIGELPTEADVERRWLTHMLALPCDQRYTPLQLERMVDAIAAWIDNGRMLTGRSAGTAKSRP